jgi:hypothetical protein
MTEEELQKLLEEEPPIIPPIPTVVMDEGVPLALVRQWEEEGAVGSIDDFIKEQKRVVDAYNELDKK